MVEVEELFAGRQCRTRLWVSERVREEIGKRAKKSGPETMRLLKKLRRYAQDGFGLHEGDGQPIRREWNGVYRIGDYGDLFRIIGFYEDDFSKTDFIALDAFLKKGQDLQPAQKARINEVAAIREQRSWRKKVIHDDRSRSAEAS